MTELDDPIIRSRVHVIVKWLASDITQSSIIQYQICQLHPLVHLPLRSLIFLSAFDIHTETRFSIWISL